MSDISSAGIGAGSGAKRDTRKEGAAFPPRPEVRGFHAATLMTSKEAGTSRDAGASVDAGASRAPFDAARPYEKHPQVAIRPESFGALAYHYGNRRLVFLKAPALVKVVETLGDFPSAAAAVAAHVPDAQRETYTRALAGLLASDVIRPR